MPTILLHGEVLIWVGTTSISKDRATLRVIEYFANSLRVIRRACPY